MYMMYSCVWCSLFLSRRDVGVHVERGGRGEGEKGRGGGDQEEGEMRGKGQAERGKGSGVGEGAATQVFADVASS